MDRPLDLFPVDVGFPRGASAVYCRTSTAAAAGVGFKRAAADDMRPISDIRPRRERWMLCGRLIDGSFADRAEQDATAKLAVHSA